MSDRRSAPPRLGVVTSKGDSSVPKTLVFVALLLLVAWNTVGVTPPNLDLALEEQVQMVEDNPGDAQVYNDLGNLLLLAGRLAEAESAYTRAVELAPFDSEIRFNYGLLLQQMGRGDEAGGQYQQVLEITPRHAWAHYQLGVMADERGARGDALDLYARAFAFDPSLTFASNNPHIIDNELTTEAILLSNRYRDAPGSRVPRYYGDASRILQLMVHDDEVEAPAEPAGNEDAAGAAAATPGEGEGAAPRRAIRPVGSESGGGSSVRGAGEGEAPRAPRAGGNSPRPNNRRGATYIPGATRGGEATEESPKRGGTLDGGGNTASGGRVEGENPRRQPNRVNRPPRRSGYRPPVRSTGRLDLELLPAEEDVAPAVRAR